MGLLTKAATWLFGGGGAETVVKTVSAGIDKAVYTAEEKAGDDASDLANARAFAAPGNNPGLVNQLVDAANRCIRPGVTLWLVGGFVGWWKMPQSDAIDPYWQTTFTLVLTFWFGGRALLKDLPAAIKAIRGVR